jgi:adenylate cyclase
LLFLGFMPVLGAGVLAMLGKLAPCGGGPPLPLLKTRLTIGRHSGCDVVLPYIMVSSRHCELELRDGYWFVHDLKSSNGTRVNGAPCTDQWLLPNDVLNVAGCRFNVLYMPPADRPPPRRVGAESTPAAPAPSRGEKPTAPAAGSGGLLGELLPCGGGNPIPLRRPRLIVGRRPECDIVVPFGVVSGRHCELEFKDSRWHVRDLNSRHGTRVNGLQCASKELIPGDVLWVANQRFKIAYTVAGGPPAASRGPMFARSLLEEAGLARWQPPEPRGKDKEVEERKRERYTIEE